MTVPQLYAALQVLKERADKIEVKQRHLAVLDVTVVISFVSMSERSVLSSSTCLL